MKQQVTLVYAHADIEAKRRAIEKAMGNDSICSENAYESNNEEKIKRLYGLK